jgi:hypothetical protein
MSLNPQYHKKKGNKFARRWWPMSVILAIQEDCGS